VRAPDVTIVGLGLVPPDDVSPVVDRALRRANEVLFVEAGPATEAWLQQRCDRVTPLFSQVYVRDGARTGAYRRMAAETVAAALDHAPVVFGMSGHPVVGALAPFLIRDLCAVLGLSVAVLPGLSSVDALLGDLWVDPFVHGLQIYEATDLLLRGRALQPDVPALVAQVGNLGRGTYTLRHVDEGLLARLVALLVQSHGAAHEVAVCFASPHPLVRGTQVWVTLEALPTRRDLLHPGVTLFVPAAVGRPIVAPDIAEAVSRA